MTHGVSGGIKGAKGGQPARLGLWDQGWERETRPGWGDVGLASVMRRGVCACVMCGSTRSCLRPRPGWIPVWVDWLPGGSPNGRERERARSRAARFAGSAVCVCLRPCGSALEPPGTHRNVASLSSPGRPLFHKEVAARKREGGSRLKSAKPCSSLKQRPIYLFCYKRTLEANRAPRNCPSVASIPQASWAL